MKHNAISRSVLSIMLAAMMLAGIPGAAFAATAQWSAFRGGELNGVVSAATPHSPSKTKRLWRAHLKDKDDWSTNISDPLIIDSDVYIAVGDELRVFDGATGAKKDALALDGSADFTCRMLFVDDTIFVPLKNGALEAVKVDPLRKEWTTSALPDRDFLVPNSDGSGAESTVTLSPQSQTTLAYGSGTVYMGTTFATWDASFAGSYFAIDAHTGNIFWSHENDDAGYYWSGGVLVHGAFIFAGDDGILTSVDASTGATITPTVDLGAPVRSTIISSGDYVLAVSQDGVLHRVTVAPDGSLSGHRSAAFADSSTSTPVVYDGKVYVGGTTPSWTGSLSVVDLASMAVAQTVDVPAAVQGSPIVSAAGSDGPGDAYIYFTVNDEPGALYVYKVGGTKAVELYTPVGGEVNYAMSTPAIAPNGTIYYTNDSGYLFALAAKVDTDPKDPKPTNDSGSDAGDTTKASAKNGTGSSEDVKTGDVSPAFALASAGVALGTMCLTIRKRGDEE